MEVSSNYAWQCHDVKRHNSPLLPSNIRGLIVGKSNSGKTIVLLNLLLQDGWLDYNRLLVFGKSLHQQEYRIIRKGFESGLSKQQISNIFKNQQELPKGNSPTQLMQKYVDEGGALDGGDINATFFENCFDQIPDPAKLNDCDKNLLILDDCLLEKKQNKAEAYYTRGRHNNCDTIYIAQNYILLPKNTIRENSNILLLFPQDKRDLQRIHADHCTDIDYEEFKDFCHDVWSNRYNFVMIDLTSSKYNGKYRRNFDIFYFPHK